MFKLENNEEKSMFGAILSNTNRNTAWNIMNSIKRVPVVPGICMVSIIQMAEYFEVPLQLIKKYTRHDGGGHPYNKYPFNRKAVGSDELAEFALSKRKIKWNGLNYWEFQFKDFTMVAPNTGLIMYAPFELLEFLTLLQDESQVARDIIMEIIRDFERYHGDWNFFGKQYPVLHYQTTTSYVSIAPLKKRLIEYDEREALKQKVLEGDNVLLKKEEFCQAVGEVVSRGLSKESEKLFDEIHKKQYANAM